MRNFTETKLILKKNGFNICILGLILIMISFTLLPISSYEGFEGGFHPLLPLLIIGLSLIGLSLTLLHKKIGIRIGPLGYFIPILITGPIYISGFEPRATIPEDLTFFHWEIGMHLIILGLILQYVGSLLVSPKKSGRDLKKTMIRDEDEKVNMGNKEGIIGLPERIAHVIIILTFVLVIIFIILIPFKAFDVL